jgi:hypothetical protein
MPYILLKALDEGESRVAFRGKMVMAYLATACLLAGCSLGLSSDGRKTAANKPSSTYAPPAPVGADGANNLGQSAPWCQVGAVWSAPGAGPADNATVSAKVIGLASFKDRTYCQAEYTMESGGQKSGYTYFFTEDGKDVWVLMDVGGQKQELHLTQ